MVDVSGSGAAFTCFADRGCPWPGQNITARFSVPRHQPSDAFDMNDFVRSGSVCRVDNLNFGLRRVAIRFFEPLPFKPGEQANMQLDCEPLVEPALS